MYKQKKSCPSVSLWPLLIQWTSRRRLVAIWHDVKLGNQSLQSNKIINDELYCDFKGNIVRQDGKVMPVMSSNFNLEFSPPSFAHWSSGCTQWVAVLKTNREKSPAKLKHGELRPHTHGRLTRKRRLCAVGWEWKVSRLKVIARHRGMSAPRIDIDT